MTAAPALLHGKPRALLRLSAVWISNRVLCRLVPGIIGPWGVHHVSSPTTTILQALASPVAATMGRPCSFAGCMVSQAARSCIPTPLHKPQLAPALSPDPSLAPTPP